MFHLSFMTSAIEEGAFNYLIVKCYHLNSNHSKWFICQTNEEKKTFIRNDTQKPYQAGKFYVSDYVRLFVFFKQLEIQARVKWNIFDVFI